MVVRSPPTWQASHRFAAANGGSQRQRGRTYAKWRGRALLERSLGQMSGQVNTVIENNSVEYLKAHIARTGAVGLQAQIGAPAPGGDPHLMSRAIDRRDLPPAWCCWASATATRFPWPHPASSSRSLEH